MVTDASGNAVDLNATLAAEMAAELDDAADSTDDVDDE